MSIWMFELLTSSYAWGTRLEIEEEREIFLFTLYIHSIVRKFYN